MREDYFNLIQRKNGYFYYYVYDKFGRRVYRSTGEKRKGKAMEIALSRARSGELLEPQIQKHLRFSEYSKDFWNYDTCPIIQDAILRGHHYSVVAAQSYARILEKILTPAWGRYYLEELTPAKIQAWIVKFPSSRTPKYSNKYTNDCLLCMRMILAQAVKEGYISKNPAEGVQPLAHDSKPKGTFTREQIRQLFKDPWEPLPSYVACLLSAKTGMRLGEIRALTVEQLQDGFIDVNASWADGGEGRKTTKSGHSRVVPVEQSLLDLLRKVAPQPSGLIFTTDGVTPCGKHYISDNLKKRMKECGISELDRDGLKLSFHSFRYFFNSRLVVANMSGDKIRATIGHESGEMTQHYTRLKIEDMEEIRLIQSEIC